MAKINIDKIRLSPRMSNDEKISVLEKHVLRLESNLEYILTHLSDENFARGGSNEA